MAARTWSTDRWGKGQAFHEAKSFGMRWTQIGLKHYINSYRAADVVATPGTAGARPATVTP